jgi:hypothetical protein
MCNPKVQFLKKLTNLHTPYWKIIVEPNDLKTFTVEASLFKDFKCNLTIKESMIQDLNIEVT